jgi:GT2 family glycosyltransferase
MKNTYKIYQDTVSVYNSGNLRPIPLENNLTNAINFKSPITASWIDIRMATYGRTVKGNLSVEILINEELHSFEINCLDISDNEYFRFELGKTVSSDNFMFVFKTDESCRGQLAVWSNQNNFCFKAGIISERTISLKEEKPISIITPVYNPEISHIDGMVKSVLSQKYSKWELVLINDGSSSKETIDYLDKLRTEKGGKYNITFIDLPKNSGISVASDIGVRNASNDWCVFLDQDDLLHEDALLEIAAKIDEEPSADLIYTDEDKVDDSGRHFSPHHKPAWSPALLETQMYTCHLSAYKTKQILEVGGIRKGYEGSQDHDLALRYTHKFGNVHHIARILYHWRVHENSTSLHASVKPEAKLSGLRALNDLFSKKNIPVEITSSLMPLGTYKVNYIPTGSPKVSIIIPTKDQLAHLKTCLLSLKQTSYDNFEIIIVNNQSEEKETLEFLNNIPNEYYRKGSYAHQKRKSYIKILNYNKEFNFSEIVNLGARFAVGDYYCLLNNDTEVVSADWLKNMLGRLVHDKDVGVVGSKLLYSDGSIQHAGLLMGFGGVAGHCHKHLPNTNPGYFGRPHVTHEVGGVTGACMLIHKKVWEEVKGFETALPKAFNDVDFCLKVREKGYRILYCAEAILYHHESVSRGVDKGDEPDFLEAVRYMNEKWNLINYNDPYWNINFIRSNQIYEVL